MIFVFGWCLALSFHFAAPPEVLEFSMQLLRPLEYQIARTHHHCFGPTSPWQLRHITKVTQSCNRGYWSDFKISYNIYSPVHTRKKVELFPLSQNLIMTQISDLRLHTLSFPLNIMFFVKTSHSHSCPCYCTHIVALTFTHILHSLIAHCYCTLCAL